MVHTGFQVGHGARAWNPRRTITPELAAMLAEARRRRGLSLRQAARRAGVTPGTIVHLEKARRAPSTAVAERIIEAYGLPADLADWLRSEAVTDAGRYSGRYC
jgi:transcriptional regulator with XRE-family HTH domain